MHLVSIDSCDQNMEIQMQWQEHFTTRERTHYRCQSTTPIDTIVRIQFILDILSLLEVVISILLKGN